MACGNRAYSWPWKPCFIGGECQLIDGNDTLQEGAAAWTCVCEEGFAGDGHFSNLQGKSCVVDKTATRVFGLVIFVLSMLVFLLRLFTLWREVRYGSVRRKKLKKNWCHDQNMRLQMFGFFSDAIIFTLSAHVYACPDCTFGRGVYITVLQGITPTLWWISFINQLDVLANRTARLANLDWNSQRADTIKWARYRAAPAFVLGLFWALLLPVFVALARINEEENLLAARIFLSGFAYIHSVVPLIMLHLFQLFGAAVDLRLEQLNSYSFRDPILETRLLELSKKIDNGIKFCKQNVPGGIPFLIAAIIPGLTVIFVHYFFYIILIGGLINTTMMQHFLWVDYSAAVHSSTRSSTKSRNQHANSSVSSRAGNSFQVSAVSVVSTSVVPSTDEEV